MKLGFIDLLAFGCYGYTFASPYLAPIAPLSNTVVSILLVLLLPGWYLVRILSSHILHENIQGGLALALVPSLSISFTIGIEVLAMLAIGSVGAIELAVGTLAIQCLSIATRANLNPRFSNTGWASNLPFLIIVTLPIMQFVVVPIFTYPPSPFPLATGWDVFTYMMIGGRVQSGLVVSPLTTINPITQQLPIPTAFPILVALLMPSGVIRPQIVVALIKYGAIIPSALGMAWIFLICRIVSKNNYLSLMGSLVAYSFAGYNVIDTKYFLPASFSWTFSLMAVYVVMSSLEFRSKLILFGMAVGTAIFFHFYSGAAATAITALGALGSNISKLRLPRLANRLAELYPVWGAGAVVGFNLLGFSVAIPGAGTVVGGLSLIGSNLYLMLRSLSPGFWLVATVFAVYTLASRRNLRVPYLHFLLLGLLIYFLPVSGMFRLLIWPAVFAAVSTCKLLADIVSESWKGLPNRRTTVLKLSTTLLVTLAVLSAAYPLLVPGNYTPTNYVYAGNLGTVQSSYSISEYSAAVYLSAHPPASNYIILSDPGFSLVLGGLTGGDAVRLTQLSNMLPFQQLLQVAETTSINQTVAKDLKGVLGEYYSISSYGGVVIALSARTYFWLKNDGVITWSPMNSSFVDGNIRSNFLQSTPFVHMYSSQDIDLFYLDFGRQGSS